MDAAGRRSPEAESRGRARSFRRRRAHARNAVLSHLAAGVRGEIQGLAAEGHAARSDGAAGGAELRSEDGELHGVAGRVDGVQRTGLLLRCEARHLLRRREPACIPPHPGERQCLTSCANAVCTLSWSAYGKVISVK